MKHKILDYIDIIPFFCALLLIVLLQPFYFWGMNMIPVKFLFFLVIIPFFKIGNKNIAMLFFLLCVYLIIPISRGLNITGMVEFVFLSIIPFLKYKFVKRTYQYFTIVYASLMVVSIIVWILVLSGVNLPNYTIDPLNDLKHYVYIAYPFLVIPTMDTSADAVLLGFLRFHSVFDEPGIVGTISLILLYINSFNFRKWYNIALFASGILSFSIFFYIGAIVYGLLILYKQKKNRIRNLIMIAIGVVTFSIIINSNQFLYDIIGHRFEYDEKSGKLVGDNRADDDLKKYFSSIRGTSIYFWGDSTENIERFSASAGYRNMVLRYGAVFFILFIIFWLLYAKTEFKNDRKSFVIFLILFIALQYQRPSVRDVSFLFLYTAFVKCYNISFNSKLLSDEKYSKNKIVDIKNRD